MAITIVGADGASQTANVPEVNLTVPDCQPGDIILHLATINLTARALSRVPWSDGSASGGTHAGYRYNWGWRAVKEAGPATYRFYQSADADSPARLAAAMVVVRGALRPTALPELTSWPGALPESGPAVVFAAGHYGAGFGRGAIGPGREVVSGLGQLNDGAASSTVAAAFLAASAGGTLTYSVSNSQPSTVVAWGLRERPTGPTVGVWRDGVEYPASVTVWRGGVEVPVTLEVAGQTSAPPTPTEGVEVAEDGLTMTVPDAIAVAAGDGLTYEIADAVDSGDGTFQIGD